MNIISHTQARNLLIDDFDFNSAIAQERITEFNDDPLVLSCALHQLTNSGRGWHGLDSIEVKESITPEIRAEAEAIRDYYTKKFFWTALSSNSRLSDYRQRLLNLLENRITKCKDQDCGIYFKLPVFYEEDQVYDQFKKDYETSEVPKIVYGLTNNQKERLDLTYLKTTFSSQRKRKIERFWFTDQKYLFQIEIDRDNPLMEMFKVFLNESETVKIQAYRTIDRIDQMYFYKLFKFNFVKE
jgi:hypothetical protein